MELFTPGHLLVLVVLAAVLFFGWKQLPDMARSLGRSLRIFKTEIKGMTEDDKAREAARESAQVTPVVTPVVPPAVTPAAPVTPATPVAPAVPVTPPADTTAPAQANDTTSVDHT